ncbi:MULTISPECIES: pathogenicity island protein [unclassified Staphylococcus]|uniref:pathogenicity island protein n=1 Tax=unclassified Staphylococcus TaxID=91994 RepID=UPI0021D0F70C|nr:MULTISPECIES: pathogenicity island protein [unclassified Staphylococcus]UXR76768.1 pathogenicity island protein [Staphylococcus sp. IVB6233]UXR80897.1 pathogenicity island protein [Staphylococcus sp. IVB6218]
MKQQVIITRTIIGWYNIKDTNHNLLLNVSPQVFEQYFPEVSKNFNIACMEINFERIAKIKNNKKVGS